MLLTFSKNSLPDANICKENIKQEKLINNKENIKLRWHGLYTYGEISDFHDKEKNIHFDKIEIWPRPDAMIVCPIDSNISENKLFDASLDSKINATTETLKDVFGETSLCYKSIKEFIAELLLKDEFIQEIDYNIAIKSNEYVEKNIKNYGKPELYLCNIGEYTVSNYQVWLVYKKVLIIKELIQVATIFSNKTKN